MGRVKWLLRGIVGVVIFAFIAVNQLYGMEPASDPGHALYPNIKKINDDFYVGKIKDKNLCLVMECVNSSAARDLWMKYAKVQYNPKIQDFARNLKGKDGHPIMPNFTVDGSIHFQEVLQQVDMHADELWVIYVTTKMDPEPITAEKNKSIWHYTASTFPTQPDYSPGIFPDDILMYATVTTSPKALLTSHMGISVSIEGIWHRRDGIGAGISMDMHSFAAKVMFIRNPQRRYMIDAPTPAMEKLIAEGLPDGSVFIGTRERKKILDDHKNMTVDQYKELHIDELRKNSRESLVKYTKIKSNLLRKVKKNLSELNNEFSLLSEHFSDGNIAKEEYDSDLKSIQEQINEENLTIGSIKNEINKKHLKIDGDDNIVITEEAIEAEIDTRSRGSLAAKLNPGSGGWAGMETLEKLMERYPPLLSVSQEKRTNPAYDYKKFVIYEKDKGTDPWLTVETRYVWPDVQTTPAGYNWMLTKTFQPSGTTHFIVVDLKNMADSKQLDPMG